MEELITKDLVERATQVAVRAHKDQVRKTDNSPYVAHPLMVARMLDRAGYRDEVVAAAIVHDVLEDTDVTKEELTEQLGDEVVQIVLAVSEDKSLPWEERKQLYVDTVAAASEDAAMVSLADKIHNMESLIAGHAKLGPDIWKSFSRGKERKLWFEKLLLSKLSEKYQNELIEKYSELINVAEKLED